MQFNLQEIVNGQPTMKADTARARGKDEFKRGVQTANLYVAKEQLGKKEQELTLREALLNRQAAELSGLMQGMEQQSSMVGGILGQVMGGQPPQEGMPGGGMPPQGMQQGMGGAPPPEGGGMPPQGGQPPQEMMQ